MEGTNRDVTTWRKSTYSADNNGNCVEVGGDGPAVMVRDTKDRDSVTLTFSAAAWAAFTRPLQK